MPLKSAKTFFKKFNLGEFSKLTKGQFKGTGHAAQRGEAMREFNSGMEDATENINDVNLANKAASTAVGAGSAVKDEVKKQ